MAAAIERRTQARHDHALLTASSKVTGGAVLWVLGINLVFLGVVAYVLESGSWAFLPVYVGLPILALPGVGVVIAWRKVGRFLLQSWKFGETQLVLDQSPVALGGVLAGRIRAGTRGHPEPMDGFRVRLSCYRRVERWRRSRRGRGHREVRYELVWRDEKQLRSTRGPDPSSAEIPVAFQLPRDAPVTDEGPEDGALRSFFRARKSQVVWRLEVLAAMPGVDLSEAIEVPVVEAPAEPTPPRVEERVREAAGQEVEIREPRSEGTEVARTLSGGLRISFDTSRHRKRAWAAGALALVLGGGTWWLWAASAPWYAIVGAVLLTLLMAWAAYDYATLSSKVVVERGQVTVKRRRSTSLPPEEVSDVRAELEGRAMRIGRTLPPDAVPATYELMILRQPTVRGRKTGEDTGGGVGGDGEGRSADPSARIKVAEHLEDKPEADWLAAKIREAVRSEAEGDRAHPGAAPNSERGSLDRGAD